MKNKKGFTLIELLATLVVLSIVLLIGSTSVVKIINSNKQKAYDLQIISFKESAKIWAYDYTYNLPENGEFSYIKLSQLQNMGYVKKDVINQMTGNEFSLDSGVCITNNNGVYGYNFSETGKCGSNSKINKKCFKISSNTIIDYYNYFGSDTIVTNSACPKDVVLETEYDGETIYKIGAYAFDGKNLNSIIIPDGYKEIGAHAFEYNKLKNVVLPDSITSVGSYAFHENLLTSVKISNNMSAINSYSFSQNSLESFDIPDTVTILDEECLSYNLISSIKIPNSITKIPSGFLKNNYYLNNITIPEGVIEIGDAAFYGVGMSSIKLPSTLTTLDDAAFIYSDLESIELPDKIQDIPSSCFSYCRYLTSIKLPNSLKTIGSEAFFNTSKLTSIIFPNTLNKIENEAFAYSGVKNFNLPANLSVIASNAFSSVESLTIDNFVNTLSGSPWGATSATITYNKTLNLGSNTSDLILYELSQSGSTYHAKFRSSDNTKIITSITANGIKYTGSTASFTGNNLNITAYTYNTITPITISSAHNYEKGLDGDEPDKSLWLKQIDGANSIGIIFSSNSAINDKSDYIYIEDGSGNVIYTLTGTQMAGNIYEVQGNRAIIRFETSYHTPLYGFDATFVKMS